MNNMCLLVLLLLSCHACFCAADSYKGKPKLIDFESKMMELDSFKKEMKEEIGMLKKTEKDLKERVEHLELDNKVKDRTIIDMEQKIEHLERNLTVNKMSSPVKRQSQGGIAFTAYLSHFVINITHQQPIVYDVILLNDGNGYNKATGMFTAPVSGVYIFSYSVGAKILPNLGLSQYDIFTRLVIDGVHQVSAVAESTAIYDDEQGSTTAILFVEEGRKVWTRHELRGAAYLYSEDIERVSSFTGAFLYETDQPVSVVGR